MLSALRYRALEYCRIASRNSASRKAIAVTILWVVVVAVALPALAQTESVVYNFANPPDAYGPKCNLVLDAAGDLYGTTSSGGANNLGSVFKISPTGTESVLYSFAGGTDGRQPVAGLFVDPTTGNLYGTTINGGTAGAGTVFTVTPAGVETVIYSFQGGLDGANPYASVVRISANTFGTTFNGGQFGYGTVFKINAAGKETVLHSFNAAFPTLEGGHPYAGLVANHGVLYGTTTMGGPSNFGTVYSTTPTGTEVVVYAFKGGSTDGQAPQAGLVFDRTGNMYGTTQLGGSDNAGTVFTITSAGESVLHHFHINGSDGANPYGTLIFNKGTFYGTTSQGGVGNGGTVFSITPSGVETVLHSFTGGADGFNPFGAVVLGKNNTVYSTTIAGGTANLGTVFKVAL